MKKVLVSAGIIIITALSGRNIYSQTDIIQSSKLRRNNINIYFGLYNESNINYERNIIQRPKSLTNLRMGFGKASFRLVRMYAYYLNPSVVQLIGRKSSHLELNLGFKYSLGKPPDGISKVLVPDLFAGYRFEKPDGRLIFRAGLNYPTLVNIGMGFKF